MIALGFFALLGAGVMTSLFPPALSSRSLAAIIACQS